MQEWEVFDHAGNMIHIVRLPIGTSVDDVIREINKVCGEDYWWRVARIQRTKDKTNQVKIKVRHLVHFFSTLATYIHGSTK